MFSGSRKLFRNIFSLFLWWLEKAFIDVCVGRFYIFFSLRSFVPSCLCWSLYHVLFLRASLVFFCSHLYLSELLKNLFLCSSFSKLLCCSSLTMFYTTFSCNYSLSTVSMISVRKKHFFCISVITFIRCSG